MMMSVSACSTGATSGCEWVGPISTSKDDKLTRQTEDGIIAHNGKVEKLCGVKVGK